MTQLFENRVKRMIKAGKKTAGAWAQLCSPIATEILGRGGFDWILVDMEHARGVVPQLPPNADLKWKFSELTNTGATGDPSKGTRAKGAAMRKVLVDAVVKFIQHLDSINWDYALK